MGFLDKKNRGNDFKRKRIAFVSASPCAGTSTIVQLMAEYASFEMKLDTSIVEMGSAHFSAVFNFEEKFLDSSFSSQLDFLNGMGNRHRNMFKGINWLVQRMDDKPLDISNCYKLLYKTEGDLILFDCSGMERQMLLQILSDFDEIVLVVDPRPSAIIENFDFIEKLLISFPAMKVVINKWNKAISRQKMEKALGRKDFIFLDYFDAEIRYKQEQSCAMFSHIWGDFALIKMLAKSIILK